MLINMKRNRAIGTLLQHVDEIRQRFKVRKLSVFGSVARDEATDESDIDILVEFDTMSTFDNFMDLKFYLEDLLLIPVDLTTRKAIRSRILSEIQSEMVDVA